MVIGLERNRLRVNAKPLINGMIIVSLFPYPFNEITNAVIKRLISARGIKTFSRTS